MGALVPAGLRRVIVSLRKSCSPCRLGLPQPERSEVEVDSFIPVAFGVPSVNSGCRIRIGDGGWCDDFVVGIGVIYFAVCFGNFLFGLHIVGALG